eukprot:scaffold213_cov66-Phaeocystis_antarctica.AAC.1
MQMLMHMHILRYWPLSASSNRVGAAELVNCRQSATPHRFLHSGPTTPSWEARRAARPATSRPRCSSRLGLGVRDNPNPNPNPNPSPNPNPNPKPNLNPRPGPAL